MAVRVTRFLYTMCKEFIYKYIETWWFCIFLQEKKLQLVRRLVFAERRGKMNDETREKLGFLNTTSSSLEVG